MQNMENKLEITINPAFLDLWQSDYREYIYYGGRYSGKNYAIAQYLCIQGLKRKCKILVLREFGVRVKDSVYADIKNFFVDNEIAFKIAELDIETKQYYKGDIIKFKATRILLEFNQTEFIFAGVNDNVVDSLKGLKDIDFCWIDEADFLTEYSYTKLKPTIRAENSKLIYTFNPKLESAFLYQKAITNTDSRVFVKKITAAKYDGERKEWVCGDNPFLKEWVCGDNPFLNKTILAAEFNAKYGK